MGTLVSWCDGSVLGAFGDDGLHWRETGAETRRQGLTKQDKVTIAV